jgi:mannose-6-phosphate isomerase-like protein (cupin superfamily)
VDYSSLDLTRAFGEMDAKQIETLRLLEGGEYNLNIRRLRGAETALVHGKVTDIWVVREGEGVLVTGGELVDPAPASAAGDFRGAGIRGGTRRLIRAGDVVFIPAGVPHGIVESKSITWLNIRFTSR